MSQDIPQWVYWTFFGIGLSVIGAIAKQIGWKERAELTLERSPILTDIGGCRDLDMTGRKDLMVPLGPRRTGVSKAVLDEQLRKEAFREVKPCGWIKDKPFQDLSNYSTCYLRNVEYGNCDVIYLVAADFSDDDKLRALTGTHFTLSMC